MTEYIDKKALLTNLDEAYEDFGGRSPGFYGGFQNALKRTKDFPTAEVEPVSVDNLEFRTLMNISGSLRIVRNAARTIFSRAIIAGGAVEKLTEVLTMADLRKGDIVQNIFAGKNNPTRLLLYIGKGTCRQGRYSHKVYDCIGYDGRKVQLFRDPDGLVKVGHMDEFDAFMAALKSLADRKDGVKNGG